jgi:hypothetical protein
VLGIQKNRQVSCSQEICFLARAKVPTIKHKLTDKVICDEDKCLMLIQQGKAVEGK